MIIKEGEILKECAEMTSEMTVKMPE